MRTIKWFIILLTAVLGSISVGAAQSDDSTVRIATYTLSASTSNRIEDTANLIARSGANIILLQRLDANEAYLLARQVDMDVAFFLITDEAVGLAVLSDTRISFDDGHLLERSGDLSAIQRVQLFVGNQQLLTFYNIGIGFDQRGRTAVSDQTLEEVFAIIAEDYPNGIVGQRIIVGGIFNTIAESVVVDYLESVGFHNPFAGLSSGQSATLRTPTPQSRMDYLWTRNMSPLSVGVIENPGDERGMAVIEILP